MDSWIATLLPAMLVMARVTAFFAVLPLFSWPMLPTRIRVSIALVVTAFFMFAVPLGTVPSYAGHWLVASVLMVKEILCGLALGTVVRLVLDSVQQGILIGTQQMGFADANLIDPSTGDSSQPIGLLYQMLFAVLFLGVGGHRMVLAIIDVSYKAFPLAETPDIGVLTQAVLEGSVVMLTFAMRMAAPLLCGFLLLAVVLGVLARVMPEMNILMAGLPLRVLTGMGLSLMVMGSLNVVIDQLVGWIDQFFLAL